MKDKKDKVYDSPPSQPNDAFWLDQGREMVKSSIPSLTEASKTMLTGLNILQGIYAGIIGFYSWLTFEKLQLELKRLLSTVRRMVSLKIPASPLKKRRSSFTPQPGGSPWN
jgi:hypothetical protein